MVKNSLIYLIVFLFLLFFLSCAKDDDFNEMEYEYKEKTDYTSNEKKEKEDSSSTISSIYHFAGFEEYMKLLKEVE